MKSADICFLWHMHQPYYTDPVSSTASMPWVRLHASKAYYDMPCLLERFPAVRATFNLTPSLLQQIEELTTGCVRDTFLLHAERPAADLSAPERAFIIRHFFAANWGTMVRPFQRYHELLVKRGTHVDEQDLERLARQFSVQDLLDLQVWHNLAWFGYAAIQQYPRLQELRRRDRGFSEEDKRELLDIQREILTRIIPTYRRLADSGQIELTTTPFYHPILPLLVDTETARRARPDLILPSRFQAPADADAQLRKAVALHARLFGRSPAGLWPSEGSVCPELIPLAEAAGVRWLATDEAVLARSQREESTWERSRDLYRPYSLSERNLRAVFRDRELSDAFGFVYSKTTAETAVEDVLARVGQIITQSPETQVLVPIILDGENPWEYYHDGGERFLTGLYTALSKGDPGSQARAQTQAERLTPAIEDHPRPGRVRHLHSGSWINADFKIWIGHSEDNRGWDLLRETRRRLVEQTPALAAEQAEAAWEELYAAEGSDWFWWYGDDFETDYKAEFDRLFRTHLKNALLRAGVGVPDHFNHPLIGLPEPHASSLPVRLLTPVLDGEVTDFFEWRGAGEIDPVPPLGAMWRSYRFFTRIAFGFNLEALYLRLDPGEDLHARADAVVGVLVLQTQGAGYRVVFPLNAAAPAEVKLLREQADGAHVEQASVAMMARRRVVELAVPFKDMQLDAGRAFRLALVVVRGDLELARYPAHEPLVLTVPDRQFEMKVWRA